MAVLLSTVRLTPSLFIAACFLAFALTACDNTPDRKQQTQSRVVSKKIPGDKPVKQEKSDKPKTKTAAKKERALKEKNKDKKEKAADKPDTTTKRESPEEIQVSPSKPAYSAAGKINPFLQLIQTEAPEKPKEEEKEPERVLTPLEKLDLSQLQLVAIVRAVGEGDDFAMVQEAGGKGYIIRKGTYIGENSGVVTRIEKDKIVIEESFKDFKGNEKTREKKMKLHKQDSKE